MEDIVFDNGRERGASLEAAVKKVLEGWLTPGSGNKNIKGDVRSPLFCAEAKYRSSNDEQGFFILVDLQWLEAIWRTASKARKVPLLIIEFGSGKKMVFLPSRSYEYLSRGEPEWEASQEFNKTGRAPRFNLTECQTVVAAKVNFSSIEVDEKDWTIINWDELIYLRKTNQEPKKKVKFR